MDIESGVMAALALGFFLGLKHATDADHVVAVSTIVSEYRNAWRGIWVGASWGLGHTAPLLVLGIVILAFKDLVLDQYAVVAPVFEFGVGLMLVYLGAQVLWNLRRGRLHVHDHSRENGPHVHIHTSHDSALGADSESPHGFWHIGKPFFRVKSFSIGVVHGLAGSAAIMLVLLPHLSSIWVGLGYLLLFGAGTILSMAAVTVLLGVPFAALGGMQRANRAVAGVAGVSSGLLGAVLLSDLALGTSLMPF